MPSPKGIGTMKGKGSKSGRHYKDNPVIDWNQWKFTNLSLEKTTYSFEVIPPTDLFRYFKNLGSKFYLVGTYVLDDGDDYEEDEGIPNSPTKYLFPTTIKMTNPDGFRVRLYRVEERRAMKIIFDMLNARHDLGSLV